MKKIAVLIAVVAISATLPSSCKKDYICKCSYGNLSDSTSLGKVTKKKAKSNCADIQTAKNTPGVTCTAETKSNTY